MKKILLANLFFLSIYSVSFCQNMGNEIPEILDMRPPSPNAYELTKYGDIPINEHLGKVSTSVEVHNYKAGMLNIPITLNYIGNGVKVDQTGNVVNRFFAKTFCISS
ncbi:hypothetical protein [Mesonia sp. K4-1]|uniref:hypothetical protein n=1 Tax=Mesonia sp. K4-1 TaxID=2602760 RepID=UPI0011CBB07B|nr:hypothetical protein [Mesonia sp. K4-1]TXK78894.1 hypothetical protein FT986_03600 [Mesonia sp. K4-1]